MFHLYIDIDGLQRKLDVLATRAEDLEVPLKQFGAYLKARAQKRYEEQDFVPLAESTIKNREEQGIRKLGYRLKYELGHARAFSVKQKTVTTREAIFATFQTQYFGKQTLIGPVSQLSFKQHLSLSSRATKEITKAVTRPILGRLGKSLRVLVEEGSVTLKSRTKGEWSAVHNEGDGHVPKRETIKLENEDLDVFIDILKQHLLLGTEE